MPITYRKASIEDLALLTQTRVMVLKAANQLPQDADMGTIPAMSRSYYTAALADGSHTAYLAFDGEEIVGTGGVSYYQVMPTCHNPTGRKAYLMNIYTKPSHRRQGIAMKMVELLIRDAREKGVTEINL